MKTIKIKQKLEQSGVESLGNLYTKIDRPIGDIIDNSIGAGATNVNLSFIVDDLNFQDENEVIHIEDNGSGIPASEEFIQSMFNIGGNEKAGGLNQYNLGLKMAITSLGHLTRLVSYQKDSKSVVELKSMKDLYVEGFIKDKSEFDLMRQDSGFELTISGKRNVNKKSLSLIHEGEDNELEVKNFIIELEKKYGQLLKNNVFENDSDILLKGKKLNIFLRVTGTSGKVYFRGNLNGKMHTGKFIHMQSRCAIDNLGREYCYTIMYRLADIDSKCEAFPVTNGTKTRAIYMHGKLLVEPEITSVEYGPRTNLSDDTRTRVEIMIHEAPLSPTATKDGFQKTPELAFFIKDLKKAQTEDFKNEHPSGKTFFQLAKELHRSEYSKTHSMLKDLIIDKLKSDNRVKNMEILTEVEYSFKQRADIIINKKTKTEVLEIKSAPITEDDLRQGLNYANMECMKNHKGNSKKVKLIMTSPHKVDGKVNLAAKRHNETQNAIQIEFKIFDLEDFAELND